MGHKIFVSYKYYDNSVKEINGYNHHTARDYVDYLQDNNFSGDDLNKAEDDNEDLSNFKDDTIKSKLKEKIWDSSITLILISPNMVEEFKSEKDQWIPWEVSYSLRTQTRINRRSRSNGLIAVVLPDTCGSYDYFISYENLLDDQGTLQKVISINTNNTFEIIRDNMFNVKNPNTKIMQGKIVYYGDCSYCFAVKWKDFVKNTDDYLDKAYDLRDRITEFNICKQVN